LHLLAKKGGVVKSLPMVVDRSRVTSRGERVGPGEAKHRRAKNVKTIGTIRAQAS